jgi:uncharacterized membrane protein (UPF0127 family)
MFSRFFITAALCFYLIAANAADFQEKQLQVITAEGKKLFTVFIADTDDKRKYGLMQRKNMPENNGMLFVFGKETQVSMWMKDTHIPLDIIFIKSDHTIEKIEHNTTPLSLNAIHSKEKVVAVLELNAGICKKLGIKENDKIVF